MLSRLRGRLFLSYVLLMAVMLVVVGVALFAILNLRGAPGNDLSAAGHDGPRRGSAADPMPKPFRVRQIARGGLGTADR